MAWIYLVIAGICETFSVAMLNQIYVSRNWKPVVLFAIAFGSSLYLLSIAMNSIPMGTAYAIWTGIGVVGGTIVGIIVYGESSDWKRIFFIGLIVISAIGLKLIS